MKSFETSPIDEALVNWSKQPESFIETIIKVVAEENSILEKTMLLKSRMREIVESRQIAMTLSKKMTSASLAEIGKKIGGKDHATVLHAVKTIVGIAQTDKKFALKINRTINSLWAYVNSIPVCSECGNKDTWKQAWVGSFTGKIISYIDPCEDYIYCPKCKTFNEPVLNNEFDYERHILETVSNKL